MAAAAGSEVPQKLPGQVSLADHDPELNSIIEKVQCLSFSVRNGAVCSVRLCVGVF